VFDTNLTLTGSWGGSRDTGMERDRAAGEIAIYSRKSAARPESIITIRTSADLAARQGPDREFQDTTMPAAPPPKSEELDVANPVTDVAGKALLSQNHDASNIHTATLGTGGENTSRTAV
jgi:hypothetical protein